MIDLDMLVCDYMGQDGVNKSKLYKIYVTLSDDPIALSTFNQKIVVFSDRKLRDMVEMKKKGNLKKEYVDAMIKKHRKLVDSPVTRETMRVRLNWVKEGRYTLDEVLNADNKKGNDMYLRKHNRYDLKEYYENYPNPVDISLITFKKRVNEGKFKTREEAILAPKGVVDTIIGQWREFPEPKCGYMTYLKRIRKGEAPETAKRKEIRGKNFYK